VQLIRARGMPLFVLRFLKQYHSDGRYLATIHVSLKRVKDPKTKALIQGSRGVIGLDKVQFQRIVAGFYQCMH
jgi:hypothetical protein